MTYQLVIEALRTNAVSNRFYQELRFEAVAVDAAIVRISARVANPSEAPSGSGEPEIDNRHRHGMLSNEIDSFLARDGCLLVRGADNTHELHGRFLDVVHGPGLRFRLLFDRS